jgi:glycosyltransferase involved in cell wall biosynthesis
MTEPWLTVVVPTYARPDQLVRCLDALDAQVEPALVLCVVRPDDRATLAVLEDRGDSVAVATVIQPGVLAAMLAGLRATATPWVAFTDDDAAPLPTWTRDLRLAAQRDGVVGVGGRDLLYDGETPRRTTLTTDVGRIGPFGRITGNHHRGEGLPRSVAVLKGVNAAYRADLLGLPTNLRGRGAEVHFEVAVGLHLAQQGILTYDPSICVVHRPGHRADADGRVLQSPEATANTAYNATFAMSARSRFFALVRAVRTLLVGDRTSPGVLRGLLALARGDRTTAAKWWPATKGTAAALVAVLSGQRVTFAYRDAAAA